MVSVADGWESDNVMGAILLSAIEAAVGIRIAFVFFFRSDSKHS
jgi:hypothetical protein